MTTKTTHTIVVCCKTPKSITCILLYSTVIIVSRHGLDDCLDPSKRCDLDLVVYISTNGHGDRRSERNHWPCTYCMISLRPKTACSQYRSMNLTRGRKNNRRHQDDDKNNTYHRFLLQDSKAHHMHSLALHCDPCEWTWP